MICREGAGGRERKRYQYWFRLFAVKAGLTQLRDRKFRGAGRGDRGREFGLIRRGIRRIGIGNQEKGSRRGVAKEKS